MAHRGGRSSYSHNERDCLPPSYGGRDGRGGGGEGDRIRGGRSGRGGRTPSHRESTVLPAPSLSTYESGSSSLSKAFEQGVRIGDERSGSAKAQSPDPPASPAEDSVIPMKVKASEPVIPTASSKAVAYPLRPGYGIEGKKMQIRGNHFLVHMEDRDIFQYAVKIEPEVKSRTFGRMIMKKLTDEFKESHLDQHKLAYDGRNIFYTAKQLPFTSKDFELTIMERKCHEKKFVVSIELTKCSDLHSLKQFLAGRQRECPHDTIQALDVVLRELPSQNYVSVSRSFFSPAFGRRDAIGNGLECWRGYYQSLRPTQMGLSLNLDISATSFYKPVKLIDFLLESLDLRTLPRVFTENLRVKANKVLKGVRVETTHASNSSRCYKITKLTSEPASQLMFVIDKQSGLTESVAQYFQRKYNYNLINPSFPCVQAGNNNPAYLPMEVCKILDGQRYSKKLNEQQVSNILRSTCKRPSDREDSIMKMCNQNNYSVDSYAIEFGLVVNPLLTTMEARVLPPPKLKYHDSGRERTCNPNLGKWNMIGRKMVDGGTLDSWACICFAERIHEDAVYYFCDELIGMCRSIGMVCNPKAAVDISFCPPLQIEGGLRNLYRWSVENLTNQNNKQKHLQLVIVVLPEASGFYGNIKTLCETDLGLVTQCCRPAKVLKCDKQYLENIALKINVKIGGRNTVLDDAFCKRLPFISDVPTIIFGADVTHPSPGDDSQSSIAAVVGSMDWPWMTTYRCLLSSQQHRQEMIQDLFSVNVDPKMGNIPGGMIRELLIEFYKATNQKPSRIIFYRDGVSEGQFGSVLMYEIDVIRKACATLEDEYLPPITFVVVQKRHHTRLFPAVHGQRDTTDRSGNILPGTVVDKTICHPTEFDFYLCSHSGIQGTSRPTHYHVLLDENKFTADALQSLTYNLCYTYARCTRSVSVVPPAYYAHLAAFRAKYYLEGKSELGASRMSKDVGMREKSNEVHSLPKIKEAIKHVMFYC